MDACARVHIALFSAIQYPFWHTIDATSSVNFRTEKLKLIIKLAPGARAIAR